MRIGLDAVAQEGRGKSSNSQDIVKIERTSSGPGVRINGFRCVIEARVERRTK